MTSSFDIISEDISIPNFVLEQDIEKYLHLYKLFNKIGSNNSQYVDRSEISQLFKSQNIFLSKAKLTKLMLTLDLDGDGVISFNEFYIAFKTLDFQKFSSPTISEAELRSKIVANWAHMLSTIDIGSEFDVNSFIATKNNSAEEENQNIFQAVLRTIAGGSGAIVSRTCTAPLERFKIIAQCGIQQSIIPTYKIIIEQQGMRGFWRGNFINCLRVFPFGGIVGLSYIEFINFLPSDDKWNKYETLMHFIAGCGGLYYITMSSVKNVDNTFIAGALATTATYPLDVIRTRVTASMATDELRLRDLIHNRSWSQLFVGLKPTLVAMSLFVGIQQSSYDMFRVMSTDGQYFNMRPSVQLFITCGMFAGVCAQTVVYPMDVVRRRIQNNFSAGNSNILYRNAWQTFKHMIKNEGARAMFAGLIPTYLKVIPSVAISVTVRDVILGRLND